MQKPTRPKKALSLNLETIRELTAVQVSAVAGGGTSNTGGCGTSTRTI